MSLVLRHSSRLNEFPEPTRSLGGTEYIDVPNLLKVHYLGENDYITVGESETEGNAYSFLHLTHYSRENINSNFNITAATEYLISRDHREIHYIKDSDAMMITMGDYNTIEIYVADIKSFKKFSIKLQENNLNPVLTDDPKIRPFTNTDFVRRIADFISPRLPLPEDFKISKLLNHDGMQVIGSKSGLIYFLDTETPGRGLGVEGILGVGDRSVIQETKILTIPSRSYMRSTEFPVISNLEDNIGKTFILQIASLHNIIEEDPNDSINIWNFPYDADEGQYPVPEATLLFSFKINDYFTEDQRVRRIRNSNLGSGQGIYSARVTAISKNVIENYNFLVGITVKHSVSRRNEHFLGILHCGDTSDATIGLNFPKFTGHISRGLSLNTDPDFRDESRLEFQQRERILSYKTMRRIAGFPGYAEGPSDPEKIEITAIEIINAETFVTGDSEGSIIMWKLNLEGGATDGKLTFMAKYRNSERLRTHDNCTIKKIENIGIYNQQLLVHICISRGDRPDGTSDITEVLNYSFDQDDATISRGLVPMSDWNESTSVPILVEGPDAADVTTTTATTAASINFDFLQEYDDYTNIAHTVRGKREMMKNVERVFDMKKDIIEPSVKSEEELEKILDIDTVKSKAYDVMNISDEYIYKFAAELDPNWGTDDEGDTYDTAVLFKTENKIYMYSKETLDSMDFPYGQMVYGCREASGEWRDENRINNIILDDLYVSLGTLIEDRGILVPLVPLLKIWRKGLVVPNNIISFCLINDRPQDMNKVVAVAKLPFSGGVGRLHCNAGGDDSADILYNVYPGNADPFLPPLSDEEEQEIGLERPPSEPSSPSEPADSEMEVVPPPPPPEADSENSSVMTLEYNYSDSGSEPGSRSRTPSLGGKRKSNRKKSLKNKRKTKRRKTLKKKKRKSIKKNKKKRKSIKKKNR